MSTDGWTIEISLDAPSSKHHPSFRARLIWRFRTLRETGSVLAIEDAPTIGSQAKGYAVKLAPDADLAKVEEALKALATEIAGQAGQLDYEISFGAPRVYERRREGQ